LVDIFIEEEKMNNINILQEITPTPRAIPSIVPLAYDAIAKLDMRLKGVATISNTQKSPVWKKYLLTIEEAAGYFGIGEKRLRRFVAENEGADYLMEVGSQVRIKRELFEQYLNEVYAI